MGSKTRNISDIMSRKISHLMFIMSILVVYIHFVSYSYMDQQSFRLEYAFEYFISSCFGRVAVPLFFCISGYLCFSKTDVSARSLVDSYGKKTRTLVLPFLLWNIFYTVVFLGLKIVNHSIGDITGWGSFLFKSIFLYEQNGVLWYVFQLIILTAIAPLLFYVYKNKYVSSIFSIAALLTFFFVKNAPIWLPLNGLGFYSLGATVAMHFKENADTSYWKDKTKKAVAVTALVIFIVFCVLRMTVFDIYRSIHEVRDTPLCRIIETALAISFWFATDLISFGKLTVKPFEQCSFLIYVTHSFAITVVNALIEAISLSMTPVLRLAIYITGPLFITFAIVSVALLLKKFLPKFYSLISGGR